MTDAGAHAAHALTAWHEFVSVADGHDGCVDVSQITKVMVAACMNYLTLGLGLDYDKVFTPTARPIIAETRITCLSPMHTAQRHCCTVGPTTRSARSITLRIEIDQFGGAPVAAGEIRLVTVDPSVGRSIDVPALLSEAIERTEGRQPRAETR